MSARTADRKYRARRAARLRKAKARNEPCAECGRPIDYDLPSHLPMSPTADHVTAVAVGGSNYGPLEPMHWSCNSRRGAGRVTKQVPIPRTSRLW